MSHAPPPLYPMYPEEHKAAKPKPRNDGHRKCPCCRKRRRKHKSIVEIVRETTGSGSRLEFCSVYGVPYLLVCQGLVNSFLSPVIALIFRNDCPALPILYPCLMARLPMGFIDALGLFLMTADALQWNASNYWISKIAEKLNWRIIAGLIITIFVIWGTVLFISTYPQDGNPISFDPNSSHYCHEFLYKYAKLNQYVILLFIGSTVALFVIGGTLLLCLLCVVSRISTEN